nr:amidohydrolase family protein [Spirochaeta sp.]
MDGIDPMIIDSHQHFWKYNTNDYVWMEDWMTGLKTDHEPEELEPLMSEIGVTGTVAVQARQLVEETDYLLGLTRKHPWILGVVGWLDFAAPDLEEEIARYAQHEKLVGLRELIHDMDDPEYAISSVHRNAIGIIGTYDLAYDLLVRPAHIPAATQLVDSFPNQRFIVDHIAKPDIAGEEIEPWKSLIIELGRRPHVYCKLSGMAT